MLHIICPQHVSTLIMCQLNNVSISSFSNSMAIKPELLVLFTDKLRSKITYIIIIKHRIRCLRYWAVTNIDYIHQRTARRIGLMILVIWTVSFLVCIAPLLGWKDPGWEERITQNRTCLVSQDIGYQIFATASSFYLPLLVILFLYWRIFQTARKRIRRRVTAPVASTSAQARMPATGGVMAGERSMAACYTFIVD